MKERIILHIDANNAFLSWSAVEMLKNGYKIDIRKTYAVIGGKESERRGIVLAKSPLCKSRGVVTGETLYSARKKCPYLKVYSPSFEVYHKYSNLMYEYLKTYSPDIERFSVDECFIDYTNCIKLFGDPIKTAYKIKEDIKNKFGFTVNVGVGNNKLLAKMASDFEKPDKVHTLFTYEIKEKMWPLDISDLFMIGKSSSKKLKELNILTIKDLATTDINILTKHFKNQAKFMWEYANGIDNSEVESERDEPKSISNSCILPYNTDNQEYIYNVLKELSLSVGKRLRKENSYANCINIWIKYDNFNKISKQEKISNGFNTDLEIYKLAINLFNKSWNKEKVRALCVGVSSLNKDNLVQLDIFNTNKTNKKDEKLQKVIDDLNTKYKKNIVGYGNIKK